MADNFDLKKFLTENKLTSNSKLGEQEINGAGKATTAESKSFVNEDKKTRFVDDLLDKWQIELGGTHPNAPNRPHYSFFLSKPGRGFWTRFDSKKYKDMDYIMSSTRESTMDLKDRLKDKQSPIKSEKDLMDWAWNKLKQMSNGRELEVSGEHGSDSKDPAVMIGDYIFIYRGTWGTPVIKYASKSILRNLGVWRS